MKHVLTILLIFAVTHLFLPQDVFPDGTLSNAGHKTLAEIQADRENSEREQNRLQNDINRYMSERDRFIALANDLKVMGKGSVGSLQTILVSTLTTTNHEKIATAFGLTSRTALSLYGSSSAASMIDSAISRVNRLHASAQWAYNNTNRTKGYDTARSAIEAWYENGRATDHYNDHVSPGAWRQATHTPNGPGNINLPKFECPGTCTNTYNTVWEAASAHYQKCGTAEPVSRLLSGPERLTILAVRSVSDGCGESWYSCDSNHSTNEASHRVRTCAKGVWKTRLKDYTGGTERYRAHTCGDPFRNCMPHKDHHGSSVIKTTHSETDGTSSTESPVVSSTPTPTDNTPNCQDCTSDCSSPCSCTNSGTCGGSSSSDDSSSDDSSSSDSRSVTLCPAHSWTGCGSSTSHATTCGGGHTYYTCNTSAVARHGNSRMCRRSSCGNTWSGCQSAPWCNAWTGNKCWAL